MISLMIFREVFIQVQICLEKWLLLIQNCKAALNKNLFTEAVLIDLSKVFVCLPHDQLAPS